MIDRAFIYGVILLHKALSRLRFMRYNQSAIEVIELDHIIQRCSHGK